MKRILRILGGLLLLLLVAVGALAYDVRQQLAQPLDIDAPVTVVLQPGSSLRTAIAQLDARQLTQSWRQGVYLEWFARQQGLAQGIRAGEYRLDPGMNAVQVLRLWLSGKTLMHELRVIEGMRSADLLERVAAHPELEHTLRPLSADAVRSALGLHGSSIEGRFFPDTYRFAKGTTDVELLRQAQRAMDAILAEEWAARAADLPLTTPEEALTLASIIEKETGLASERGEIAGVFVRRLRLGMRLQTDPTVIYGLGDRFDGNLRRVDLLADTPYNTYTRSGLPPSPICLPGRAAIHAALHPADGNALYFVARGDGSHHFSPNLSEHQAAVRRFQLGQ